MEVMGTQFFHINVKCSERFLFDPAVMRLGKSHLIFFGALRLIDPIHQVFIGKIAYWRIMILFPVSADQMEQIGLRVFIYHDQARLFYGFPSKRPVSVVVWMVGEVVRPYFPAD